MINVVYKRTIVCDICGLAHRDEVSLTEILDSGATPPLPTGWACRSVTICPICMALKKNI